MGSPGISTERCLCLQDPPGRPLASLSFSFLQRLGPWRGWAGAAGVQWQGCSLSALPIPQCADPAASWDWGGGGCVGLWMAACTDACLAVVLLCQGLLSTCFGPYQPSSHAIVITQRKSFSLEPIHYNPWQVQGALCGGSGGGAKLA